MSVQTIKDAELNELRRLARAHAAALTAVEQTQAALATEHQRLLDIWQPRLDALTETQQESQKGEHLSDLVNDLNNRDADEFTTSEDLDDWLSLKGM